MTTAPPLIRTRRLHGVRAIVTGGARGIGEAIARRMTADGAIVAILDRLQAEGISVASELGGPYVRVDLADPDDTRAQIAAAASTLGGVDVLVNSAGVFRLVDLLDIEIDEWDRMMDINARAILVTMQAVAPAMIAQGRGRIINISSMAAKAGGAHEGHYAASKAAVVALTRAAALEWGGHGITVNAVCPGYVLTDMGEDSRTPEQIAEWSARSPLGRLATPQDVAAVVSHLASSDAAYVTGEALNVTGGMIMH
ncbi:SDR family NAD(P)-dependent oxidoreductase [Microbacterium sp. No. 7]|uniref:SDR family NAD(P)-dependent oxidoreductase n=1 Tax=Microbacterium sp. No. 7 TaxID=1714373 RepID=UPI0006D09FD2|nr:SDR family NAD(P)-dependent oxidoreductase [Microbacterium sp. No. 7]ALJ22185.1 short-chain dehydrogenase [Microbacterium sp. No. 7]